MRAKPRFVLVILATIILGGCAAKGPEMKTVDYVDIDRFMGSWYVIANIPTFLEKEAYNAVETYSLNNDGTMMERLRRTSSSEKAASTERRKSTTRRHLFWMRNQTLVGECGLSGQSKQIIESFTSTTTIPRQLSVGRIVTLSGSWRVRLRSLPSTMTN
jgi:hypothetical protein